MVILGFGVDLLHAPRIGQLVARRGLGRLARRILTEDEQLAFGRVASQQAKERFLAVRWAAKEALYKALQPQYTPTWQDVSVLPSPSNALSFKPVVVFSPTGTLANERLKAHLSVSHDGEFLVAGVVVEQD